MYYGYWQVRANRAIRASLLRTHALVTARRQTLALVRQTLRIEAVLVGDSCCRDALRRHYARVADYHRAYGQLLRLSERLGARIDRQVSYAALQADAMGRGTPPGLPAD